MLRGLTQAGDGDGALAVVGDTTSPLFYPVRGSKSTDEDASQTSESE
jgi:hypothetical protein